ncbi:MAG: CofH family radical SAM protein [Candidatus Brocadiae bacterium]|nr:CofH family radical SAM protein [Candidatus Brocadiia bacterium]
MDPNIILKAAIERQEVSAIEALMLMQQEEPGFADIYQVANELNRRTHQGVTSFVHRTHIYYTNVCRASCRHCSLFRKKGDKEAYTLTPDQVVERVQASPVRNDIAVQGALNPDLSVSYLVRLIQTLRDEFPHAHIHAFSPTEVHFAARRARVPAREVLEQLKEAGLDSMPGTGADILNDKVRKKISPDRIRTADWVEIVKSAHRLGIKTTASILVGHVENEIHICEHLEIIRNIQKDTGGIVEFQILPMIPEGAAFGNSRQRISQQQLLKLVAISRIFFGNSVQNIQVPWALFGLPEAIQCLSMGANDLGGTHFQGGAVYTSGPAARYTSPELLEKAILKAQRRPRQRDSVYGDGTKKTVRTRKAALALR